eukprot:jgi/Chrpa1/24972/Chrysochromulina_OHIO_Genome00005937-RA
MRQRDTEPESLEISMLRLLLVALQLDFALPAALDEQEANAIQFEVQTTLQFESAGKTIHPAINFVTNLFEPRDTNPPPA